jgi:Flp pilus assembly protein protease CpaA
MLMWAALFASAVYCQRTTRLPNLMTVSLILYGLALGWSHDWHGQAKAGTGGLDASVACLALAFVLALPWYAKGFVGAGAVKLEMGFAACAGACFGLHRGLQIVLLASVLAPAVAACLLARALRRTELDAKGHERFRLVPVGYAVAIGAVGSVLLLDLLHS